MAIRRCTERGDLNPYKECGSYDETYAGRVLGKFERNGYDDSDFCAIVWDADRGVIRTVEYASTRGWTYHNTAAIDATPETIAAAEAYLAEQIFDHYRASWYEIEKGKQVESTTTRGQAVGAKGTVAWIGERRSRYGTWSQGVRVGIRVEGESKLRFVDLTKVRVLGEPSAEELAEYRAQAEAVAAGHNWRTLEALAYAAVA